MTDKDRIAHLADLIDRAWAENEDAAVYYPAEIAAEVACRFFDALNAKEATDGE